MKSRKVMGLSISPSKSNAKKFAHDLALLQAEMYHLTNIVNFLDQDGAPGHLNYELNKFGIAVAEAVKEDLRANPTKKQLSFYLHVLAACWEEKNYEIGARIKQGIVNAMLMDLPDESAGADRYAMPEEDPKTKAARDALKEAIKKIDLWQELSEKDFPEMTAGKRIYGEHLQQKEVFIPSIETLMKFIAIRLDNAKSLSIDETVQFERKMMRMLEYKNEILNDLIFIETILEKCLPKGEEICFKKLRDHFKKELLLKLPPSKDDPNAKLDDILKLHKMRNQMRDSVKLAPLAIPAAPVSPRNEGLFTPSPRKKLVHLRSNASSPRSNPSSPREEVPPSGSNPASPRIKLIPVRNLPATPRSNPTSPREGLDRPKNPTRPDKSPRNK